MSFKAKKGNKTEQDVVRCSHKIELIVNNKQRTHFRKAFGCARLAYNWALGRWQENYKAGIATSCAELKKEFNAIKGEKFPFVYEVSKYATQQPFLNLQSAFDKFFKDLEKGKVSYPQFKKKRDHVGSYYIGGDVVSLSDVNKNSKAYKVLHTDAKAQYLKVPKLGYVKMTERLRFEGKINSVTISQKGDKFYASFNVSVPKSCLPTHPRSDLGLGIDLGVKSLASLSNGLAIQAPKPLTKLSKKLSRKQRQLSRKQCPKTKGDKTRKSNNYKKASLKVNKLHRHIADVRSDFLHKLTSVLVKHVGYFCLESLNVKGMMKNHKLAKAISDVGLSEFKRKMEYKSAIHYRLIHKVDTWYPSSKTCSCCGHIKDNLDLSERIYHCENCQAVIDRDYNAALNLFKQLTQQVGQVLPEFTPADLLALQADLDLNLLPYKVNSDSTACN